MKCLSADKVPVTRVQGNLNPESSRPACSEYVAGGYTQMAAAVSWLAGKAGICQLIEEAVRAHGIYCHRIW
jgi:hypothetical protein